MNTLKIGIVNDMCGIGEDAMASPKMLLAKKMRLGGLRFGWQEVLVELNLIVMIAYPLCLMQPRLE